MAIQSLPKEIAEAIHQMVFVRYLASAGIYKEHFQLQFDPEMTNDLRIEPVYQSRKIIITTKFMPIGKLEDRFHSQMNSLAKNIIPMFVFEEGKSFIFNHKLVKLEVNAWSGVKNIDKHARFMVTNLVGVRVVDAESGATVTYVEEGSSLFDVRDKVVEKMYREGK